MTLLSKIPRSLSACLAACFMAGSVHAQQPHYSQPQTFQRQVCPPGYGPAYGPQNYPLPGNSPGNSSPGYMLPPAVHGEGRVQMGAPGTAPNSVPPAQGTPQGPGTSTTPNAGATPNPATQPGSGNPQTPDLQSNYDPNFGAQQNDQSLNAAMQSGGGADNSGYLSDYAPNMMGDYLGIGRIKQYQFTPGLGANTINFSDAYGLFEGRAAGFIPGTTTNQIHPETDAMGVPLIGNQQFVIDQATGTLGSTGLPITTLTSSVPGHPNPGPMAPPSITPVGIAPTLPNVFNPPVLDPNSLFLETTPDNASYADDLERLTVSAAPGLQLQLDALQAALTAEGIQGNVHQTTAHSAMLDNTFATLVQIPDFTDLNGDGVYNPGGVIVNNILVGEEFTDFNANNVADPGEFNDINQNGMLDPGEQFDHNANGMIDGEFTYLISPVTIFSPGIFTFTQTPVTFYLPQSPGALVGRQKIGENGSPKPRQRYFFNYSFFDNTNFGGNNVNRFVVGFEKTFLNDQASFEMRIPMASRVNNEITSGAFTNSGSSNIGDVTAFLKYVIYDDSEFLISVGTGVSLPTADDILVKDSNGTKLIQVQNEAVHVLPFIGFLSSSRNSNLFYQGFVQGDFDVNGNPVSVTGFENSVISYTAGNVTQLFNLQRPSGRLQETGDLNDPGRLLVDLSVGYWIDRPMPYVQRIAPLMELHVNTELDVADTIKHGNLLCVGSNSSLTTINGTVGLAAEINSRLTANVGYSFPLGNSNQSEFDGELRAFLNWYFPNGFRNL